MSKKNPTNIAASVHARLVNKSKEEKRPFNELLQYYAMERFLYRLSVSLYADKFILKGALMLRAFGFPDARPTMDIDLEGMIPNRKKLLLDFVKDCMEIKCDDGIAYLKSSVTAKNITQDADYAGVRLNFKGKLGNAILHYQLDVGFGDKVTPEPKFMQYPEMLDFGSPKILVYTLETSIAEKLQAMIELDMANSRMKDFYDIDKMSTHRSFEGPVLQRAIAKTFAERNTPVSENVPIALTINFAENPSKIAQWNAFTRKLGVAKVDNLHSVIKRISAFVMPVLRSIDHKQDFNMFWQADGKWRESPNENH